MRWLQFVISRRSRSCIPVLSVSIILTCALASAIEGTSRGRIVNVGLLPMLGQPLERPVVALRARRIAGQASDQRTSVLPAERSGEPLFLKLNPGIWEVTAEAPGFWFETREISVPDNDGPPLEVTVRRWPVAVYSGALRIPAEQRMPSLLQGTFQSPPDTPGQAQVSEAKARCPVERGRWRCALPATRLDIRLEAPGFAPAYLWDANPKNQPNVAEHLQLRSGASVSGFVNDETGRSAAPPCALHLATPDGNTITLLDRQSGKYATAFTASVNQRGFFQLAGVPPGSYLIVAEDAQGGTGQAAVEVRRNAETLSGAIALRSPLSMAVEVSPPRSPADEDWRLQVVRLSDDGQAERVYPDQQLSDQGILIVPNMPRGTYEFLIKGAPYRGAPLATWGSVRAELVQDKQTIPVNILATRVFGVVRLEGEPLRTRLTLKLLGYSTETLSDHEGSYSAFVPQPVLQAPTSTAVRIELPLRIDVTSDNPPLNRVFRTTLEANSPEVEIPIDLEDRRVRGLVVAEHGTVVADAVVEAYLGDGLVGRAETSQDGRFEIRGLPPATIRLEATGHGEAHDGQASEALLLDTRSATSLAPRLVLQSHGERSARVLSEAGVVAGAQVQLMALDVPAGPRSSWIVHSADGEGAFSFAAPNAARSFGVLASAAGLALRIGRLAAETTATGAPGRLEIHLDSAGGMLKIEDLPAPTPGGGVPYVVHNGYWVNVSTLSVPQYARGIRTGSSLILPFVEPGRYSVCTLDALRVSMLVTTPELLGCTSGDLPPGGTLVLHAGPASDPSAMLP